MEAGNGGGRFVPFSRKANRTYEQTCFLLGGTGVISVLLNKCSRTGSIFVLNLVC